MDDFAQSREPDDLFSDDIEPTQSQVVQEKPAPPPHAPRNQQASTFQPPQTSRGRGAHNNRAGRRGGNNGTANSAHTDAPTQIQAPPASSPKPSEEPSDSPPPTKPSQVQVQPDESRVTSVRGDRSATGPAKPTKKTEAELSELMKSMQLKNAAKSEAHARAEKDQASFLHREQQAATKRTEERKAIREQDMERAKNRERKIKAQGGREWDSEKQESDIVDSRNRGSSSMYMRGAHGGVSRGAGLAGSRFGGDEEVQETFHEGRGGRGGRGRGRGRGDDFQGRRGDGGRGGRGGRGRGGQSGTAAKGPPALAAETDFPALPTKAPVATTSNTATDTASNSAIQADVKDIPIMSPVGDGDWAEEMATPVEKS
jgi:hypothetical protein